MGIPVDLQPPPQFERSLLGYATINFGRIRDALNKAFGGDYQSGIFTQPAIGLAALGFNVPFPRAFAGVATPHVLVTPVNYGVGNQWTTDVGLAAPTFFSCWANLIGGGVAAQDFTFRWIAWFA